MQTAQYRARILAACTRGQLDGLARELAGLAAVDLPDDDEAAEDPTDVETARAALLDELEEVAD